MKMELPTHRLLPDEPFPPYAFVPGRFPHPISDPAGHSYHRPHEPVLQFDPTTWATCKPYLYGIDLFNHGYYWEAHETWESLWLAVGRIGPIADFLKGLIKLAAAGVKMREGNPAGMLGHAERAAELFHRCEPLGEQMLGLRLIDLIAFAKSIGRNSPSDAISAFRLLPSDSPCQT